MCIDWLTDWLTDCEFLVLDWLDCTTAYTILMAIASIKFVCIDWQTDWLTDWRTDWLTDWRTNGYTDWQTEWLSDWRNDGRTGTGRDRPTDRLSDCSDFREQSLYKLTNLLHPSMRRRTTENIIKPLTRKLLVAIRQETRLGNDA